MSNLEGTQPSIDAYCTSGTSPTARDALPSPDLESFDIHLLGPGQVGQALLELLQPTSHRVEGSHGLSLHVLEWSQQGVPLRCVPELPPDLALGRNQFHRYIFRRTQFRKGLQVPLDLPLATGAELSFQVNLDHFQQRGNPPSIAGGRQ